MRSVEGGSTKGGRSHGPRAPRGRTVDVGRAESEADGRVGMCADAPGATESRRSGGNRRGQSGERLRGAPGRLHCGAGDEGGRRRGSEDVFGPLGEGRQARSEASGGGATSSASLRFREVSQETSRDGGSRNRHRIGSWRLCSTGQAGRRGRQRPTDGKRGGVRPYCGTTEPAVIARILHNADGAGGVGGESGKEGPEGGDSARVWPGLRPRGGTWWSAVSTTRRRWVADRPGYDSGTG